MSITGPFMSPEAIIPQILEGLGSECKAARDLCIDLFFEGKAVTHVTSTLGSHPNLVRRVQVVQMYDPFMAVQLPGPSWTIMVGKVLRNVEGMQMTDSPIPPGSVVMEDTRPWARFASEVVAIDAARRLARSFAIEEEREVLEDPRRDLPVRTSVAIVKLTGPDWTHMLTVVYDSGQARMMA